MLVTVSEIKAFISNLNADSYTTAIQVQIPLVEEDIIDICNNKFARYTQLGLGYSYLYSPIFQNEDNTIYDTITDFTDDFVAGDSIYIHNSLRNDGVYSIDTVEENTLTVNSLYTIQDEDSLIDVEIYLVVWPKPLKQIAARMISYNILQANQQDLSMKSERINDYNYTRADKTGLYPNEIIKALGKYTIPRFV